MLQSCVDKDGVIQIKIVQGAKPGEGGELGPGKVVEWVATLRQSTPGVGLPSPAPMHDLYSIEDLQELIYDLKSFRIKGPDGKLRTIKVDIKIASTESCEIVGIGAAKAGVDIITVAGHEGGTGASTALSQRGTGQDGVMELAKLHNGLKRDGPRSTLQLVYEGGNVTNKDILLALKYADTIGQGTFEMIVNKCLMARVSTLQVLTRKH